MSKLIVMVGLPRAGKSTRAKELSKQLGAPIIGGDAMRLALHGERFLTPAELLVHPFVTLCVRALFHAGHEVVIIDECNVSPKRRERWLNEFGGHEIVFEFVATSKEECIARAQKMGDAVIIPVIERMAAELDPLIEK